MDTDTMDVGQAIYVLSRLGLGALASFFAIMLWARTRDIAWMLMVIGIIAAYVGTIHAILGIFGIGGETILAIGSMPLVSIILPNVPMLFFIAAFAVMVFRKYRTGI